MDDGRKQRMRYRIRNNKWAQMNTIYGLFMAIPAYPEEAYPRDIAEILGWGSDKTFLYLNKMPVSVPVAMSDDGAYCFTSSEDKRRFLASRKKKLSARRGYGE